jgi:protein gp37
MSGKSSIEWTEHTWNPVAGCTKVSPGCKHCYAEKMAVRLQAMGVKGYENGFKLSLVPDRLEQPLKRKVPTTYFVNSMSDLFHESVPFHYIDRVFAIMKQADQHIFQVLTKRAGRMAAYFKDTSTLPSNIWLGVSVEDRQYGIPRVDYLRQTPAAVRFLSIEPLLEDLGMLGLKDIHWVIVGGESGSKARIMLPKWVENIQRQCQASNVPFFFKQWGSWGSDGVLRNKKANGRLLLGQHWDEMPSTFRIKDSPETQKPYSIVAQSRSSKSSFQDGNRV